MKIGKSPASVDATSSSSAGSAAQRSGTSASASSGSGARQAGSSTVTLSPQLGQLQHAMALAGSGEVFDAGQVASIKQAISAGQFQVNPEKVADNLLESVREMLTAQGSQQGA